MVPVTLMLTTAGPFCAVICAKLGSWPAAAEAAMAGGGVTARAWWAPINPAPVAPSAPAVTRASTRRRGVDAIVFMVVCLSNRVAMKGSVGGHA